MLDSADVWLGDGKSYWRGCPGDAAGPRPDVKDPYLRAEYDKCCLNTRLSLITRSHGDSDSMSTIGGAEFLEDLAQVKFDRDFLDA